MHVAIFLFQRVWYYLKAVPTGPRRAATVSMVPAVRDCSNSASATETFESGSNGHRLSPWCLWPIFAPARSVLPQASRPTTERQVCLNGAYSARLLHHCKERSRIWLREKQEPCSLLGACGRFSTPAPSVLSHAGVSDRGKRGLSHVLAA